MKNRMKTIIHILLLLGIGYVTMIGCEVVSEWVEYREILTESGKARFCQ